MPPKNDVWKAFESLSDAVGKSVKYKSDKSHSAAWCKSCLDECVRIQQIREAERVEKGEIREARSQEQIRHGLKKPELAHSSGSSTRESTVVTDHSGVIPICGKQTTMAAHLKRCPFYKPNLSIHHLGVSLGAENEPPPMESSVVLPAASPGSSPITVKFSSRGVPLASLSTLSLHSLTRTMSAPALMAGSSPATGSPTKRAKIHGVPAWTSPQRTMGGEPSGGDAHLRDLLQSPCASCPCHHWDDARQKDFAADLCRLFVMCNIPWNAADNTQMELFFEKWLPGAKLSRLHE
ncbi:hypothetical protein FKP32DRAFT_1601906 [Trametes sanguinea]|nr:hypothetical protein FKP32DRAFT_1601906 [Trametes sanguinea]